MRNENADNRHEPLGLESAYAEFRVNNGRVILCLVLAALMCLVGVAFIAAGLLVAFPEPVINKRVLTILVGACALVLALILFASNWKKYGQRVLLFSEGFRFERGRRSSVVLWDNVSAVWRDSSTIQGSLALLETNLWIQEKDGKMHYLTSFFLEMGRLVEIVLTETARRMVPAMRSQLQNGQTIDFGKLKVSATHLEASGKELAWDDVAAIRVAHGAIDVLRTGNASWYYTPIKKMPNYHVFLALAETLSAPKRA